MAGYVTGPTIAATAVRWNPDGSVTVLSGLAVDSIVMATAVNQLGEVVGFAMDANLQSWGVWWSADGSLNIRGSTRRCHQWPVCGTSTTAVWSSERRALRR